MVFFLLKYEVFVRLVYRYIIYFNSTGVIICVYTETNHLSRVVLSSPILVCANLAKRPRRKGWDLWVRVTVSSPVISIIHGPVLKLRNAQWERSCRNRSAGYCLESYDYKFARFWVSKVNWARSRVRLRFMQYVRWLTASRGQTIAERDPRDPSSVRRVLWAPK